MCTGRSGDRVTVRDGGIRRTRSFCKGPWTLTQACRLRHHLLRRNRLAIALYARVSTTRQQQTQTMAHQLERRRGHVAAHPDWPLAEEHIEGDDGYSGAQRNRPGV